MRGDWLALGAVATLATVGVARRRGVGSAAQAIWKRRDVVAVTRGNVVFDDDTKVPVTKIGQGAFARVYMTAGSRPDVYAVVKDGTDASKEMLAWIYRQEGASLYLPSVSTAGSTPDAMVYRMPWYRSPLRKGDSATAWKQYRVLRQCWDQAQAKVRKRLGWKQVGQFEHYGYEIMAETVECAERDKTLPVGLVEALRNLRDYAADYGADYTFEFAPRNLATTPSGRLVLLDVVFSMRAMRRKRGW